MPGWYERVQELQLDYDVELVGLIQEQHPERCSLFLQWKEMDFPILVDRVNEIGVSAVPLLWAIDEGGVVRAVRPDFDWIRDEFLETEYEIPDDRELLDTDPVIAAFHEGEWSEAIESWSREEDSSGVTSFRLGCAYRARYDSDSRQPGDFQSAVAAWTRAIDLDPNNYIWRRRIQQYGPRMEKPYPFYDWIEVARQEIQARGEDPVTLPVEPRGAELALPAQQFSSASDSELPDPEGKVDRDDRWIAVEAVVTPSPVVAGQSARISLSFRPNSADDVHWTNDAGPLQAVVQMPEGWQSTEGLMTAVVPADQATSAESRVLDLEVLVPEALSSSSVALPAYALYFVCQGAEGSCVYRRQDFSVSIPVRAAN